MTETPNTSPKATPIGSMDLQDKMTAIGAIALGVLLLFPWWSVEIPKELQGLGVMRGVQTSWKWTEGWQGKLSLVAAALTAVWMILPGFRASMAQKLSKEILPFITVILAGLAFVLGPFWFLLDAPSGGESAMGASIGKTFWFWLALLAGLACAGGAAWKTFGSPKQA